MKARVTFLGHSGFLLETEYNYLLFDYWKGELPALAYDKPLYVFVSHSHHDHYSKNIFKLEHHSANVRYILSDDIKTADRTWKRAEHVIFMKEYETQTVGSCEIETLRSTDLGVAFLIKVDGISIYHAGDLHWWEWPGEPEDENEAAIRNYKAEIDRISGRSLDIAFVVLDPRQEEAGDRGMDYFLSRLGANYVFPMHLWEDYRLTKAYKSKKQMKYVTSQIMEIEGQGQTFDLNIERGNNYE